MMDDVRWALGIFDRGDRNDGWMMYLYSSKRRTTKGPSIARESMMTDGIEKGGQQTD